MASDDHRIGWYRKRPVEVQAMRWLPENLTAAGWTLGWMQANGCYPEVGDDKRLLITTLEGVMAADPEDVIIRGVQGEFYPCKPDIFAATYEAISGRVTEATAPSRAPSEPLHKLKDGPNQAMRDFMAAPSEEKT